ncbi:MAG: malto-oligosyltrehalose synthase [Rickettsiales bacterium]
MAKESAALHHTLEIPTATYRFQLRPPTHEEPDNLEPGQDRKDPGLNFSDVEKQIPYLKKLGISHVYLSPITAPITGSRHGYNTIDYHHVNPEIGGDEGFKHMADALHAAGMKIIVDFVPNHMGIEGGQNPWWQDVLKRGEHSKYNRYFDIAWNQDPQHKVIVPFLGKSAEDAIKDREFRVQKNEAGEYYFDYWGKPFPINDKGQELLKGQDVDAVNSQQELLKEVLDKQYYRPVFWLEGLEKLNYRRFFSITDLAGIRIEDPEVFTDVHRTLKQWADDKVIDGVRIDHIDGLRDPEGYLKNLRALLGERIYITAEKILGADERLPSSWPEVMQGTTGYDHMIAAGNVFIKPSPALSQGYARFIGAENAPSYEEIMRQSRVQFMEGEMKPELDRFQGKLKEAAKAAGHDFNDATLRVALKEVTAAFPIYRTYISDDHVSDTDKKVIATATGNAKKYAKDKNVASAIDFIGRVLDRSEKGKAADEFVMGYQQFTGPIIAKGTEDTAFYRYNILRGAVEVGAELDKLGLSPEDFTRYLQQRMAVTMNASSTHDNKLGEDTRARAVTLSHIPEIWSEKALQWKERFASLAKDTAQNGKSITAEDQYLFFQTLVASYPLELMFKDEASPFNEVDTEKVLKDYTYRMQVFMAKALREAKVNTRWVPEGDALPDKKYEEGVQAFVAGVINDKDFAPELQKFTQKVARMGANVSLSQRILQATSPGVPDIYQGSESWNLALVDPDNRRTPDFSKLDENLDNAANKDWKILTETWPDGIVKQVLTQRLLKLREQNPDLFLSNAPGELVPLQVYNAQHEEVKDVIAFARVHGQKAVIVAVPAALNDDLYKQKQTALGVRNGRLAGDLEIELPESLKNKSFVDTLREGKEVTVEKGSIKLRQAFHDLPGAVMGTGLSR